MHELNLKGKIPLKQARPLDALHHMLQEASVLSSHLRGYRSAVDTYASKADRFFDALHDFMASSGAREEVRKGQGGEAAIANARKQRGRGRCAFYA